MPVVLRTLVLDPVSVDPRDLADELDHLWDTGPPEAIKLIIAGVLVHLAENGVKLSALNAPKPRKRKRKRARGARRKASRG